MPDEQDIKIALLEREVMGLRDASEDFRDTIKELRSDIRFIFEFINRSKGGFAVLFLAASSLGGMIVAFFSWGVEKYVH